MSRTAARKSAVSGVGTRSMNELQKLKAISNGPAAPCPISDFAWSWKTREYSSIVSRVSRECSVPKKKSNNLLRGLGGSCGWLIEVYQYLSAIKGFCYL